MRATPRLVPPAVRAVTALLTAAPLTAALLGCRPDPVGFTLYAGADSVEAVSAFARSTPGDLVVHQEYEPVHALDDRERDRLGVAVVLDLEGEGVYRIGGEERAWTIHASDRLGAQYGLADLFEQLGYRFFHPFDTRVPDALDPSLVALDDTAHAPAIARRGLHLHTLHPIEGLDAFWTGGEEGLDRAERILDWTVKNRANYIEWVALDDIESSPTRAAEWADYTASVNALAHRRGLTTGLGVQLFGSGNLQRAFDLIDSPTTTAANTASIDERLGVALTGTDFDRINLSFGEFFAEEPSLFIDTVNQTLRSARAIDPEVEMAATVHVGGELTVTYEGEELPYYFLVKYADPEIVPLLHTVMYYNLYEDAGGAYAQADFSEHREFIEARIRSGEPVGYYPETAYWVAFDDCVPTYLPLYMRSRGLDLDRLAEVGTLPEHLLFSTGWEWGYWQNDAASLRLSYDPSPGWQGETEHFYAPWGSAGAQVSAIIEALAEAEHRYLIEQRLAGYLAGRDAVMDLGYKAGIVSQPERLTAAQIVALDTAGLADFQATVVEPLAAMADELTPLQGAMAELSLPDGSPAKDDPWLAEVRDGVIITATRARYVAALAAAAHAFASGGEVEVALAQAEAELGAARGVVDERHAHLHDPAGATLISPDWDNPTIYDYGYLLRADELCFWERERAELDVVMGLPDITVPACAL
jgi:hypothetical protein